MRRLTPILVIAAILLAFLGTLGFLWAEAREPEVVYETEAPFVADIVKKTVATGAIVPRNEVDIKPRVSGIITELPVEPGQKVQQGDLLARIRVVPDSSRLATADAQVRTARLALQDADRNLEQAEKLYAEGALSDRELQAARYEHAVRTEELTAAGENLRIIREGASGRSGQVSTEVRSTVSGTVLAVPVRVGTSVIEANTFNEGTTIASVADMEDLVFLGRIDESEVGRLREGMELDITVAAYENRRFTGTLEYISPKGVEDRGAVQFEIRAAMVLPEADSVMLRAGCSANADVVLDRREQVLAIHESLLQFDKDGKTFVEVETAPQVFERRDVEVGLSDGLQIEVKGGLGPEDQVKKPNPGAS